MKLDRAQIEQLLPHRPPFLLVDEVVEGDAHAPHQIIAGRHGGSGTESRRAAGTSRPPIVSGNHRSALAGRAELRPWAQRDWLVRILSLWTQAGSRR